MPATAAARKTASQLWSDRRNSALELRFRPISTWDTLNLESELYKAANRKSKLEIEPEFRLLLELLSDAVWTVKASNEKNFTTHVERKREIADECVRWIMSDAADHCFDYRAICDHFGFSHTQMRKAIIRFWGRPAFRRVTHRSGYYPTGISKETA